MLPIRELKEICNIQDKKNLTYAGRKYSLIPTNSRSCRGCCFFDNYNGNCKIEDQNQGRIVFQGIKCFHAGVVFKDDGVITGIKKKLKL